ncbi:MAG: YhcH/YjgK/YiaL family protein [Clostridia bacterium]|nr:YhcH/YjgK/YiaL family protein [Clostridia bacterium]
MIFDKISNLAFYKKFDERFSVIIDFLSETDVDALEPGSYPLPEGIFANVSEYAPLKDDFCYEAHRKYADLQYLHSGNEFIEWMPLDELTDASEYNDEADFLGTTSEGKTKLTLSVDAGSFAYFAPCDVHRPGKFRKAEKVKKIVFKIPVKE